MSDSASPNRWWESYLVRYLMPSVAGILIVNWICSLTDKEFREILFLSPINELTTPTLILLILYGNLFCYIASYPILCFHATRVIDFQNSEWHFSAQDGYFLTLLMGAVAFFTNTIFVPSKISIAITFILVAFFSAMQVYRFKKALVKRSIRGLLEESSIAFGYLYSISKRRGLVEEKRTKTRRPIENQTNENEGNEDDDVSETLQKVSRWRKEAIETYRHMREHGNSAFIFFLELVLAALCYHIVSVKDFSAHERISLLGLLFSLWAFPSILVHLLGQLLERRFSQFDRRMNAPDE